jgi:hypothetical protein
MDTQERAMRLYMALNPPTGSLTEREKIAAMGRAINAAIVEERDECAYLAEHEIRAWSRISSESPEKSASIETARVIARGIRGRAKPLDEVSADEAAHVRERLHEAVVKHRNSALSGDSNATESES